MRSKALACIVLVCSASCRDSSKHITVAQLPDQHGIEAKAIDECETLSQRRVGALAVQSATLRMAIDEIQTALQRNDLGLFVLISTQYQDFTGHVTLVGSDYTVASLANDLCKQIKGSWTIDKGKGYFLTFRHPGDTRRTVFSHDPSADFQLPEEEDPVPNSSSK